MKIDLLDDYPLRPVATGFISGRVIDKDDEPLNGIKVSAFTFFKDDNDDWKCKILNRGGSRGRATNEIGDYYITIEFNEVYPIRCFLGYDIDNADDVQFIVYHGRPCPMPTEAYTPIIALPFCVARDVDVVVDDG